MKLSKDQMDMLEKLGTYFFSYKEAAIVLEVSEIELKKELANSKSQAHKRYYKGKFITEMELREAELKMAKRGSSPALKSMNDLRTQTNLSNIA